MRTLGLWTLLTTTALAAPPTTVPVQGSLRNLAGPVDGTYKLTVALYATAAGGTPLYEASIGAVTVVDGVFSASLAGVGLDAARDAAFVGVKVEGEPELPLMALGSTLGALVASRALDVECTGCVERTAISTAGCQPGHVLVAAADGSVGCTAGPSLDGYARLADLAPFAKSADLAAVATSGLYGDLGGKPTLPVLGASCTPGSFVVGLAADGTLSCAPLTAGGTLALPASTSAGLVCDAAHLGATYVDTADASVRICNGTIFQPIAYLGAGTKQNPGASCKALKALLPAPKDGLYWVNLGGTPTEVYCDMTTAGGGWMLATYGYRATSGGSDVYYLPNASQGTWDPAVRAGRGSVDATSVIGAGVEVALTIREGGAPVTGNLLGYDLVYTWKHPGSTPAFGLATTVITCATVTVSELKSGASFSALTLTDRPQVSCSGHKGGTAFERQFIGFNSEYCYGACGSDPLTSNGFVVWYGDGYDPTTSGKKSDPERAGSFAVWFR